MMFCVEYLQYVSANSIAKIWKLQNSIKTLRHPIPDVLSYIEISQRNCKLFPIVKYSATCTCISRATTNSILWLIHIILRYRFCSVESCSGNGRSCEIAQVSGVWQKKEPQVSTGNPLQHSLLETVREPRFVAIPRQFHILQNITMMSQPSPF